MAKKNSEFFSFVQGEIRLGCKNIILLTEYG
jgi:hypothetical protein